MAPPAESCACVCIVLCLRVWVCATRYAMHANNRPMLYCVVQHGGQEWCSRIVDQVRQLLRECCLKAKACCADQWAGGPQRRAMSTV